MAGLERRLDEAAAALVTLEEVAEKSDRTLVERDGAILRLIYTFEAIWKACQQLLAEREGIEVASPNATIRGARRLSWLLDEDAQAAIRLGRESQPCRPYVSRRNRRRNRSTSCSPWGPAAPLAGRPSSPVRRVRLLKRTSFFAPRVHPSGPRMKDATGSSGLV